MSLVLGCVWYLFSAGLTLAGCALFTVVFAALVSHFMGMPYYGPYEAYGDVQWVMIVLILHHNIFGPQSRLIKKIGKYLDKKQSEQEE